MKSETNNFYIMTGTVKISIHSLNEEWDTNKKRGDIMTMTFQSTHSMKSETNALLERRVYVDISIHSLNEEWDNKTTMRELQEAAISIHSLNEEWDGGF